jgi:hypothetical protein
MEKRNQCRLNAYRRVQQFVDEHPTDLGMLRHSLGWRLLDRAITRLHEHANDQCSAELDLAGRDHLRKLLESELLHGQTQPIRSDDERDAVRIGFVLRVVPFYCRGGEAGRWCWHCRSCSPAS